MEMCKSSRRFKINLGFHQEEEVKEAPQAEKIVVPRSETPKVNLSCAPHGRKSSVAQVQVIPP